MHGMSSEPDRLRNRVLDLQDSQARADQSIPTNGDSKVCVTTAGSGSSSVTYPSTSSAVFFLGTPQQITGAEIEGAAGTATSATPSASFYALNLGTEIPPVGTQVITTFVDSRWVFRYDG